MTKIIWIDLDEVLAETLDQILVNNNYILAGKTVSREDILDYYIFNNKHIWIEIAEAKKIFQEVFTNHNAYNIQKVSWSYEKIIQLKNDGYTLKIVTGRSQEFEDYSFKWLQNNFWNIFDSLHFANHFTYTDHSWKRKNKSEICKELGITIMIEDIFDYALDLAENWIYTYLIEKPWNKHIKIEHANIKKVKHWDEIII